MKDPFAKLNRLEKELVAAVKTAEAKHWAQAEEVHRLLSDGYKQREVAAGWINAETGESYSQSHVSRHNQLWGLYATWHKKPQWSEAFSKLTSNRTSDRQRQREVAAPTTFESALELVTNLQQAPAQIRDTILFGLKEIETEEDSNSLFGKLPKPDRPPLSRDREDDEPVMKRRDLPPEERARNHEIDRQVSKEYVQQKKEEEAAGTRELHFWLNGWEQLAVDSDWFKVNRKVLDELPAKERHKIAKECAAAMKFLDRLKKEVTKPKSQSESNVVQFKRS